MSPVSSVAPLWPLGRLLALGRPTRCPWAQEAVTREDSEVSYVLRHHREPAVGIEPTT